MMLNRGGFVMTFAKLVLVGALSAFALTAAQAAPRAVPASSIAADSAIELVAAKKKVAKKKVAKKGKKVAKVGPGKCGTMKYWNKKTKKCASKG
jgi:hypothetical protein